MTPTPPAVRLSAGAAVPSVTDQHDRWCDHALGSLRVRAWRTHRRVTRGRSPAAHPSSKHGLWHLSALHEFRPGGRRPARDRCFTGIASRSAQRAVPHCWRGSGFEEEGQNPSADVLVPCRRQKGTKTAAAARERVFAMQRARCGRWCETTAGRRIESLRRDRPRNTSEERPR